MTAVRAGGRRSASGRAGIDTKESCGVMQVVCHPMILATDGAKQFDAYLATPASASGAAILLLSDMFGLNAPIRAIADGWAARGHPAMVPNLFWRSDPPGELEYEGPDRQRAWERLRTLNLERVAADLSLAVHALRARGGKVAAIGFCGGGLLAFLAAARAGVDAAVAFYALGISKHLADLPKIACPMQFHYGTKDEHVPKAEVH